MVFLKPQIPKNFPSKKMTENLVITEDTVLGAPEFEDSAKAMNELKGDPKFMVAIHERQLDRMASVIEELAERLISLEAKVIELETETRFPQTESPIPNLPHGSGRTGV